MGTLGSTRHPVFCAQLQEVVFPRAFGQGTLPARAFPLRVGKETSQAAGAAHNQGALLVASLWGDLQIRAAVLPREAVSGLGGQEGGRRGPGETALATGEPAVGAWGSEFNPPAPLL